MKLPRFLQSTTRREQSDRDREAANARAFDNGQQISQAMIAIIDGFVADELIPAGKAVADALKPVISLIITMRTSMQVGYSVSSGCCCGIVCC